MEQKYPDLLTEECKVVKPDKVLKYGTAGERERQVLESVRVTAESIGGRLFGEIKVYLVAVCRY